MDRAPRPGGRSASARSVATASTRGGRELAWKRGAVSPRASAAAIPASSSDRVLAVDLQHPAVRGHDAHRGGERIVGQAEVVDHERLRGGDAGLDRCRQLGQRVVGVAADGEAQADVDGTVAVGRGAPLADAREERAFRGRGGAGPGVVEGEERGRATERGRDRVLVEAVRHRVRGDPRVGVDVDDAGEHQEPGRIDHLGRARRRARQVGLDRLDDPAPDRDVRPPRPVAVTTVPPRMTRSVTRPRVDRSDRLGALPQAAPAHLAEPVVPAVVGHDGREVVGGELPDLRGRRAAAVREEDLAFADAARVDRQLSGRRVRGVVLVFETRPEVAERDPRRLARPAAVDELRVDRQHPPDGLDGLRRRRLPAGGKVEVAHLDPQRSHLRSIARRNAWPTPPAAPDPRSRPTSSTPSAGSLRSVSAWPSTASTSARSPIRMTQALTDGDGRVRDLLERPLAARRLPARVRRRARERDVLHEARGRVADHRRRAQLPRAAAAGAVLDDDLPGQLSPTSGLAIASTSTRAWPLVPATTSLTVCGPDDAQEPVATTTRAEPLRAVQVDGRLEDAVDVEVELAAARGLRRRRARRRGR